jgi:hypothetical protein
MAIRIVVGAEGLAPGVFEGLPAALELEDAEQPARRMPAATIGAPNRVRLAILLISTPGHRLWTSPAR